MGQGLLRFPVLKRDVRRLAFGCEPLGGFNWGDVDIPAIEAAVQDALDAADTHAPMLFDTADTYGPHLSEERLGRCLAGQRDRAVVASKFGVRLTDGRAWYDTSPAYADRALDASLERLKMERLDLYQLHWPDTVTPLATSFAALERFREEGRIGAYGVSNVAPADLASLAADFPGLSSFSLSYSLLDRDDEVEIAALCDAGLVFLPYGCLAQGLLSGKYGAGSVFGAGDRRASPKYRNFHGDRLQRNLRIVEALKSEATALAAPAPAVALAFVLAGFDRCIPLAGIKSGDQLNQCLGALDIALPDESLARLQKVSET
ncbi:aldo/keto reductase [Roseovarius spongiae]|uniref:Aldo/keto reductase n=1 Tax=Roseovarius spongiae TaxID=2320272 RepID=A0A3A8ARC8_9RHOB|nr:aldo/keto reductase [Roseovarius spongiae]RKF12415.1 aldo/keto reductase [Roseovarius spongiae]